MIKEDVDDSGLRVGGLEREKTHRRRCSPTTMIGRRSSPVVGQRSGHWRYQTRHRGPHGGGGRLGEGPVEAVSNEASVAEKRRTTSHCFRAASIMRWNYTQGGQGHGHGRRSSGLGAAVFDSAAVERVERQSRGEAQGRGERQVFFSMKLWHEEIRCRGCRRMWGGS
jgi:hypothetical protein